MRALGMFYLACLSLAVPYSASNAIVRQIAFYGEGIVTDEVGPLGGQRLNVGDQISLKGLWTLETGTSSQGTYTIDGSGGLFGRRGNIRGLNIFMGPNSWTPVDYGQNVFTSFYDISLSAVISNGSVQSLDVLWSPNIMCGKDAFSWSAGSPASARSLYRCDGTAEDLESGWLGSINMNYVQTTLPAVPEPNTWAIMVVGFGITGAVMRRRRGAVVAD
jgi:hypothetical protein